jgi:hypothetical protein
MIKRMFIRTLVAATATVTVFGIGTSVVLGSSNVRNDPPQPAARSGANAVVTSGTGAIIWKDATGAVVPFFLQFGFGGSAYTDLQGGMFADANGIVWAILGNVIQPAYAAYNDIAMTQYWDGTGCTGTPYVPYAHARFAFTLLEQQNGKSIRAVQDNAPATMQFMQSYWAGSCTNQIVHVLVTPMSNAPVVTPPAQLPFTLPVHPEMSP